MNIKNIKYYNISPFIVSEGAFTLDNDTLKNLIDTIEYNTDVLSNKLIKNYIKDSDKHNYFYMDLILVAENVDNIEKINEDLECTNRYIFGVYKQVAPYEKNDYLYAKPIDDSYNHFSLVFVNYHQLLDNLDKEGLDCKVNLKAGIYTPDIFKDLRSSQIDIIKKNRELTRKKPVR